jgi:uncharacterized protein
MSDSARIDSTSTRYLCQRCGNCCRWPGDVRVTDAEVGAIAAFLGWDESGFIATHTRVNANRTGLSLIEKPDGSCIFLEGVNICRRTDGPGRADG